jgi:hypothetical protein
MIKVIWKRDGGGEFSKALMRDFMDMACIEGAIVQVNPYPDNEWEDSDLWPTRHSSVCNWRVVLKEGYKVVWESRANYFSRELIAHFYGAYAVHTDSSIQFFGSDGNWMDNDRGPGCGGEPFRWRLIVKQ